MMDTCGSRLAATTSGPSMTERRGGLHQLLSFYFCAAVFSARKLDILLLSESLGSQTLGFGALKNS